MKTSVLDRTVFRTSRLLDFCSRKELIAQTGHEPESWPLVLAKELVDNALDACEEAKVAPSIRIDVKEDRISVQDNGPGIQPDTVKGVLDFNVRASSREAYLSPTRGAQGNALKTIVAMPFVLDGREGQVEIAARGIRHQITMKVDRIRQEPVIDHDQEEDPSVKSGTLVTVYWPESASSLGECKERFLQILDDYTFLNPHLTLEVNWEDQRTLVSATDPSWQKWRPSDPTSPHWYGQTHLERLIAAYIANDSDRGTDDRTVRAFLTEFAGLSGSAKQKLVLDATGTSRMNLSGLCRDGDLDREMIGRLLDSMKANTRPVKPSALGIIGKEHLRQRFEALGCKMETFNYVIAKDQGDGLPEVVEAAFAWCPDQKGRRLVTGVNWSPGILNPFRSLGEVGKSLDTVLEEQRAGEDEPIALLLQMACPRVEYTDRGKSAVVISN